MRILLALSLTALAGCMSADEAAEMTPEARSELAAAIGDRVPEAPVACVNLRDLRGNRSVGDAILFEGSGNTIFVNRAADCPALRSGLALSTRTPSARLCRGDIARVFDPITGVEYGSCGLGDFTPYRRR